MSCFATLKEKGLRLTLPRKVILEYIHNKGGHLTADEIINHAQSRYPHINKSTIYRTLELLEKNQCVFKSDSDGRTIYHHTEEGHHHHMVCSKCGTTIDGDEDLFSPVEQSIAKKYGFHVDFKHVVMNGLCERCKDSTG